MNSEAIVRCLFEKKFHVAILAIMGALNASVGKAQPLGGGEGYGDWVSSAQADYYVYNKADLEAALASATAGKIIYVDDNAKINMSGEWNVEITKGVTLASGRGRNGSLGGMLYTTTMADEYFLKITDSGVRITGLRIGGPTMEVDGPDCGQIDATGILVAATIEWQLLSGANKSLSTLNSADNEDYTAPNLATGDFNDDGFTDVFRAHGSTSQFWDKAGGWHDLANFNIPIKDLGFGDFDGDGSTDLFHGNGTTWRFWNTTGWHDLADSSYTAGELRFGDFNDDRVTDVFRGTGTKWVVSWGGTTAWQDLADSVYMVQDLAFGDFNGDGVTDVFRGTGTTWVVSWGGTTAWQDLADSEYLVKDLGFGDFNGDDVTDVFLATGTKWRVSWGGATAWVDFVDPAPYRLQDLLFGDFDGDGTDDVLVTKGEDYSLEIDNNELWAWPASAISINRVINVQVHHNHIHHNRRRENTPGCEKHYGLGYGVRSDMSEVLIENNLFDHNRHDIAGTGRPGSNYVARFNLSSEGLISHSFDMHGCNDRSTDYHCLNNVDAAGTSIHIEHNTFLQDNQNAVVIRGIPEDVAYVANNIFAHPRLWPVNPDPLDHNDHGSALYQRYATGNFVTTGNTLDHSQTSWFIKYGGVGAWKYRAASAYSPASLGIGDFNGDGAQDLFRTSGGQWRVADYGRNSWQAIRTSTAELDELAFGDFNGDGVTDVFRPNGTKWYVSWSGASSWVELLDSSYTLEDIAFGDFNGDGVTDVFRPNGTKWYVSLGGNSAWQELLTSSYTLESLAFGDFNGDGATDVFRANGSNWYVSWGGASGWQQLSESSFTLASLRFCDFNGDSKTDVFRISGSTWKVSHSATGSWTVLQDFDPLDSPGPEHNLENLAFGDFNGDNKCDVMFKR